MPSGWASSSRKLSAAIFEPLLPDVGAVDPEQIERRQDHAGVVLAGVQALEV
jgi:hypothetical protein